MVWATVAPSGKRAHIVSMDAKEKLRVEARTTRDLELDRHDKSLQIQHRVENLREYRAAQVVAAYVGIKSEVETRRLLEDRLDAGASTAVVYREGPTLGLCLIHSLDELEAGAFGLWEPNRALRVDPHRRCSTEDVDLFLVPGLAFDLHGGRVGYGRGYYDSLLGEARPDAVFLAMAFESQIVDQVPMTGHDVPVHMIATERTVHRTA
jgi:5-formyltetrahydrofolate cyclo-ligase